MKGDETLICMRSISMIAPGCLGHGGNWLGDLPNRAATAIGSCNRKLWNSPDNSARRCGTTSDDPPPLTDTLALWLAARYAVAAWKVAETGGPDGWGMLREMCGDVVQLRRGDHRAQRLILEREREATATRDAEMKWKRKLIIRVEALAKYVAKHLEAQAAMQEVRERKIREFRFEGPAKFGRPIPVHYLLPSLRIDGLTVRFEKVSANAAGEIGPSSEKKRT